ncbi:TPA: DUF4135 domain-containing protein [Vibrio diabolicus]
MESIFEQREECLYASTRLVNTFVTKGLAMLGTTPTKTPSRYFDIGAASLSKNYSEQLLLALQHDHNQLEQRYNLPKHPKIQMIQPLGGDPHCGGKVPLLIAFEGGEQLVFKPRAQYNELFFFTIAQWLASKLNESLVFPSTLSARSHSWSECISHKPCCTLEDVEAFYYKSGLLLFLYFWLKASDINHENVIAHKDVPVPIDLEFLATYNGEKYSLLLDNSVLGTLAIPLAGYGEPGDPSTLGLAVGSKNSTDEWNQSKNTPEMNNELYPAQPFVEVIKLGFKTAYECVLHSLGEAEPLLQKTNQTWPILTRVAFRTTKDYAALLDFAFREDVLSLSPDARRQQVASVIRQSGARFKSGWTSNAIAFFFQSELDDLLMGDIPIFYISPDRTALINSKRVHCRSAFSHGSGQELDRFRTKQLSREDCQVQLALISTSFQGKGK